MEINERVVGMLEQSAQKLNITAEHLWGALVAQAPIQGLVNCCYLFLFLISSILCLRMAFKFSVKGRWGPNDPCTKTEAITVIYGILCCISVLWGLVMMYRLPMSIGAIVNPDYWALNELATILGVSK